MVLQYQYGHGLSGTGAALFRTADKQYQVIWAEQLDNGTIQTIVRQLKKSTIDFTTTPPMWGPISSVDIATPSGFNNPVNWSWLNYDFQTDELLLVVGEWDFSSDGFDCTKAKLLAVKRDFSSVRVLHGDLLALIQTADSGITHIEGGGLASGYGGKTVGTIRCYAGEKDIPNERPIIITFDGSTWTAHLANSRYNYNQLGIKPIWDANDNFIGWLTVGHGTNSHFIDTSLNIKPCWPPDTLFSTEPIFDPINHKVVWTEWGSATGAVQHVHVSDPDAVSGCVNFVDKTPYGAILDKESNMIILSLECKGSSVIYSDAVDFWLAISLYSNITGPPYDRAAKVNLQQYDDSSQWEVLTDASGNDKMWLMPPQAIDPVKKLFIPSPIIMVKSFA
jgi:hypothetical protein